MFGSLRPALWDLVSNGYDIRSLHKDVCAGIIVGIVALPLALAFSIAAGVSPEQGMVTAFIGGFLISLFSGSRVQIGGPAGAFILIVYGIIQTYGYEGLALATMLAGLILILLAAARLGDIIKFIPWPVTIGFTSGMAVVIFTAKIPDALGLTALEIPKEFFAKFLFIAGNIQMINGYAVLLTALTVGLIVYWPKVTHKIPGTFVAIVATSLLAHWGRFPVESIGTQFGPFDSEFPRPRMPQMDWSQLPVLFMPAFAIAMLAGIESLLSAVVSDGMIGKRHRSNAELMAQGIANIVSPLFGGIPVTGAIARTVTNVKHGGHSPVAGIVHALTILIIFLFLGTQVSYIPMATLAGILMVVAYNMSEYHLFAKMFRAQRSDLLVMLTTFLLTVLVDLAVAINVGVLLAMLLFMRSVILSSQATAITGQLVSGNGDSDDPDAIAKKAVPPGVEVYEINGPLFFGAAEKFKSTLHELNERPKVLILRMRHVPMIDATGIKALEEITDSHFHRDTTVVLSGVQPMVLKQLDESGFSERFDPQNITPHIDKALERAAEILPVAAKPKN